MDPALYRAAQLGNLSLIEQYGNQINTQQTRNGNTVLHIVSQFYDSSLAVETIHAITPNLLLKLNINRQTPLHIASRKGHSHVVRALIDCAKLCKRCKRMLRSRDENGNLALHEAVQNNRRDIVKLLVEEDPEFSHGKNHAKESPLYLSIDKGYHGLADLILSTCKSPSYGGPQKRTALHAAAIKNSAECTKLLLEKLPNLRKKVDKFGWTPLHYAARFNHHTLVGYLLHIDRSIAYNTTNLGSGRKTALHVAAAHGHIQVIEEILSYCPDCWEMVTHQGRNVIHLAVVKEQKDVLDFMLEKSWASELLNQKDANGNTPLHLYASTKNLQRYKLVNHPEVDMNALNNDGFTPLDIVNGNEADMDRKTLLKAELEEAGATPGLRDVVAYVQDHGSNDPEMLARRVETYLIVATLIITVTFAASFTVPGGYDSSGTVVLKDSPAFTAFILSNFFAMILSIISVFCLLISHLNRNSSEKLVALDGCRAGIGLALLAMVISSVTGLYAELPSWGVRVILLLLTIPVCLAAKAYYSWPQPKNMFWAKSKSKAKPFKRTLLYTKRYFRLTNED